MTREPPPIVTDAVRTIVEASGDERIGALALALWEAGFRDGYLAAAGAVGVRVARTEGD
ncbi:MAG TPA: hypothetical protein VFR23_24425 [Jiangellaceae bacterium]|nr:hypothetical protein [Jiangellaceae bacterium]